jgi:hypothetical protein
MIRSLVYPGDPIRDIRVRVRDSIQFRFGDFSSFSFFFSFFLFFLSVLEGYVKFSGLGGLLL